LSLNLFESQQIIRIGGVCYRIRRLYKYTCEVYIVSMCMLVSGQVGLAFRSIHIAGWVSGRRQRHAVSGRGSRHDICMMVSRKYLRSGSSHGTVHRRWGDTFHR